MKESGTLQETIKMLAPGTPLREGLENILRAKTGGLVVISNSPQVMEIVEGGFNIDKEFTPAALYELGKMDGAIILSSDVSRIIKANVHLVPQANIPSAETGIRHRIASRVAKQTGAIVIAISQRRSIITLYQGSEKHVVRETPYILSKANQAIQTLDKYRFVLNKSLNKLSILEFENTVTVQDMVEVVQRLEAVSRVAGEIKQYIYQLGTEGRLINMQLEELMGGIWEANDLILKDYYVADGGNFEEVKKVLQQYASEEKLDILNASKILGYGSALSSLDKVIIPRGYRMLHKLPRLPVQIIDNLVKKFGAFPKIVEASVDELEEVDGIGEVRAKTIKEGLQKLREQLFLDPNS